MTRPRSFKQVLLIADMAFGGGPHAGPTLRFDLPGSDVRRARESDFVGRRRRPVPLLAAVP
ncbi:MAG: hypothetical protein ACRD2T_07220 [Thermoanaerobaculia bacterium]